MKGSTAELEEVIGTPKSNPW